MTSNTPHVPNTVPVVIDGIPVFFRGDIVTYLGYEAMVTASNAPVDGWTDSPARSATIAFTGRHGRLSPQIDMYVSALILVDGQ